MLPGIRTIGGKRAALSQGSRHRRLANYDFNTALKGTKNVEAKAPKGSSLSITERTIVSLASEGLSIRRALPFEKATASTVRRFIASIAVGQASGRGKPHLRQGCLRQAL